MASPSAWRPRFSADAGIPYVNLISLNCLHQKQSSETSGPLRRDTEYIPSKSMVSVNPVIREVYHAVIFACISARCRFKDLYLQRAYLILWTSEASLQCTSRGPEQLRTQVAEESWMPKSMEYGKDQAIFSRGQSSIWKGQASKRKRRFQTSSPHISLRSHTQSNDSTQLSLLTS